MRLTLYLFASCLLAACTQNDTAKSVAVTDYFTYGDSLESGGVRMIPIKTPAGQFNVWTKRFGT
jgi:proline iminopeptidase